MAVGVCEWPAMNAIAGVRWGVAAAGIKYANRNDVVVAEFAPGTNVTGVFTQNTFCAAPVIIARKNLAAAETRYLLINSGNANACTGARI